MTSPYHRVEKDAFKKEELLSELILTDTVVGCSVCPARSAVTSRALSSHGTRRAVRVAFYKTKKLKFRFRFFEDRIL